MKATTPPFVALVVMFVLGNLGAAVTASTGSSNASGFISLYYIGVAWAFAWWVLSDARERGIPTSVDHGWFAFIAWPVLVPYHVLRTRRAKGVLLLGLFALIFLVSYIVALFVFALLS